MLVYIDDKTAGTLLELLKGIEEQIKEQMEEKE